MSDDKIRAIPTAKDELAGALDGMVRLWQEQRRVAAEIAKTRRALYSAYVKEGFTEQQALELCKSLTI